MDLDALSRLRRRLLAPQILDQTIRANDLIGVQQQHRQQRSLLVPGHLNALAINDDFKIAEESKVHPRPSCSQRP
jgi:hypothetical protein